MTKTELINDFRQAFARAEYVAEYGDTGRPAWETPRFVGRSWWLLEDYDLMEKSTLLFNLTISEAVYYCPAVMICTLRSSFWFLSYHERFFYHILKNQSGGPTDAELVRNRFSLDQKRAIAHFFELHRGTGDEDLDNVFEQYWQSVISDES